MKLSANNLKLNNILYTVLIISHRILGRSCPYGQTEEEKHKIPSSKLTLIRKEYIHCTASQAVRHWLFTTKPCDQSQEISCEIHGNWSGTGAKFSPSFFGTPLLITIPLLLHTQLWRTPEECGTPDEAAYYHIFGLRGFISDPALGWLQSKEVSLIWFDLIYFVSVYHCTWYRTSQNWILVN
jgi:hypothetical protein